MGNTRGSMRNNRKSDDSSSEEENNREISSKNRQMRNVKQNNSYEKNNYDSKCNENYLKGKKNYLKCKKNICEKDETIVSLNKRGSSKGNKNQQERNDCDYSSFDTNNTRRRRNTTHRETFSQDNSNSESSTSSEWVDALNSNLSANQLCCIYCKMTFSRQVHLSRHLKNNCLKNPDAKCNSDLINTPYVCRTCGLRFKMQKLLNYHLRHACGRTVMCDICHTELKGLTVSRRHKIACIQKHREQNFQNKTENKNQQLTFSDLSPYNLSNEIECCDSD